MNTTPQSSPPTKTASKIAHLMLIDDNAFDQNLYKRVIERSDLVEVLTQFTDAEDALKHLSNPSEPMPTLILLDVSMPGMDGFEFLDAIRAEFSDGLCSVIIMLTTSMNPLDRERAFESELVKSFLNKPLTQSLLEQIASVQTVTSDV